MLGWYGLTKHGDKRQTQALSENLEWNIKCSAESVIPIMNISEHFLKPWWSSQLQRLGGRKKRFCKTNKESNVEDLLILCERALAEFKILEKKLKKL